VPGGKFIKKLTRSGFVLSRKYGTKKSSGKGRCRNSPPPRRKHWESDMKYAIDISINITIWHLLLIAFGGYLLYDLFKKDDPKDFF
jgi:hypothetical protein